jgi:chromosome segregation ATPase
MDHTMYLDAKEARDVHMSAYAVEHKREFELAQLNTEEQLQSRLRIMNEQHDQNRSFMDRDMITFGAERDAAKAWMQLLRQENQLEVVAHESQLRKLTDGINVLGVELRQTEAQLSNAEASALLLSDGQERAISSMLVETESRHELSARSATARSQKNSLQDLCKRSMVELRESEEKSKGLAAQVALVRSMAEVEQTRAWNSKHELAGLHNEAARLAEEIHAEQMQENVVQAECAAVQARRAACARGRAPIIKMQDEVVDLQAMVEDLMVGMASQV